MAEAVSTMTLFYCSYCGKVVDPYEAHICNPETRHHFADKGISGPTPEPRTAAEILNEVRAVLEERERNYDDPVRNFTRIADIWTIQLEGVLADGQSITPEKVAELMIGMKLAREMHQHKRDNYDDIIGYAVCGSRMHGD